MQRIERYGVIALVLLLVTILAVSLWGERKSGSGLLSVLKGGKKPMELAQAEPPQPPGEIVVGERDAPARPPVETWTDPGARKPPIADGNPFANGLDDLRQSPVPPERVPDSIPSPERNGVLPDPAPRPGPKPPAPTAGRIYVVQAGETLGHIAQRELGSARRWTEIQALNDNIQPEKVLAGMSLRLPSDAAGTRSAPAGGAKKPTAPAPTPPASGGRTYVVRSGDSLSSIAARELGSGERWKEILALNPRVDPKRLQVGNSLVLPGAPLQERPRREETVAVAGWSQPRSPGGSGTRVR